MKHSHTLTKTGIRRAEQGAEILKGSRASAAQNRRRARVAVAVSCALLFGSLALLAFLAWKVRHG